MHVHMSHIVHLETCIDEQTCVSQTEEGKHK